MRLLIAAIGKLKDDEERAICARYAKRLAGVGKPVALGPLEIREMPESRASSANERKDDEARRLLKAADGAFRIALNAGGKLLTSEKFAAMLGAERDAGAKLIVFLIGGPDGHGDPALDQASLQLSLGSLTLPHGLARVVLVEQLYRAATILAGHPYHRA